MDVEILYNVLCSTKGGDDAGPDSKALEVSSLPVSFLSGSCSV